MIFTIILTVICFFWLANTTITFSPFTFKCERPWHAIGMFMIIIGVAITNYNAYRKGTEHGIKLAGETIVKMIEEMPIKPTEPPTDLEGSENY
jgi:amino acid transporter